MDLTTTSNKHTLLLKYSWTFSICSVFPATPRLSILWGQFSSTSIDESTKPITYDLNTFAWSTLTPSKIYSSIFDAPFFCKPYTQDATGTLFLVIDKTSNFERNFYVRSCRKSASDVKSKTFTIPVARRCRRILPNGWRPSCAQSNRITKINEITKT